MIKIDEYKSSIGKVKWNSYEDKKEYYAVEREEACQIKTSLLSYKRRLEEILKKGGTAYNMTEAVKELEECEKSIKYIPYVGEKS